MGIIEKSCKSFYLLILAITMAVGLVFTISGGGNNQQTNIGIGLIIASTIMIVIMMIYLYFTKKSEITKTNFDVI